MNAHPEGSNPRPDERHPKATAHVRSRPLMQPVALVFGVVFLLVGIAGFIPGITTDYDTLKFAGHESEAKLFGVFQVSVLHNILHLVFGVAGVLLARTWNNARRFLIGGGLAYAGLWIYGMATEHDNEANFVPLNDADDWLHLGLALAMLLLGLVLSQERRDIGSDFPG
jgi:hypothetical protein